LPNRKALVDDYVIRPSQERFNVYDAVAAVNAVQKLKQAGFPVTRMINDRTTGFMPPYESGSASSSEDQNNSLSAQNR
jgi:hypothetical protein